MYFNIIKVPTLILWRKFFTPDGYWYLKHVFINTCLSFDSAKNNSAQNTNKLFAGIYTVMNEHIIQFLLYDGRLRKSATLSKKAWLSVFEQGHFMFSGLAFRAFSTTNWFTFKYLLEHIYDHLIHYVPQLNFLQDSLFFSCLICFWIIFADLLNIFQFKPLGLPDVGFPYGYLWVNE